jgi:hypothetical protein
MMKAENRRDKAAAKGLSGGILVDLSHSSRTERRARKSITRCAASITDRHSVDSYLRILLPSPPNCASRLARSGEISSALSAAGTYLTFGLQGFWRGMYVVGRKLRC